MAPRRVVALSCWLATGLGLLATSALAAPALLSATCADDRGCVESGVDFNGFDLQNGPAISSCECEAQCNSLAQCSAWTFLQTNKWCYLKSSDAGRGANSACVSGRKDCAPPAVCAASSCDEYYTDFLGYDILSISAPSKCACQSSCESNANCAVWTYAESTRQCYLKSSSAGGRIYNPLCISGPKTCTNSQQCDGRCFETNVDFVGHDLAKSQASTACACEILCHQTAGCSAWTFHVPSRFCYMKTGSLGRTANTATISGVLNCAPLPSGWTCGADYYNASNGCHCGCGVRDPDCDKADNVWTYCNDGEVYTNRECGSDNQCVSKASSVPASWTCNPDYYNGADGCDCSCGAHDPDCDLPESGGAMFCAGQHCSTCTCDSNDECVTATPAPTPAPPSPLAPAGWTCSPLFYNSRDGCDCSCGVHDPDCDFPDNAAFFGTFCDSGSRCDHSTPACSCENDVCVWA